ncbi:AraC family transcriptional regulator [Cupriavidus sp. AU9028]|uniref:AraC family transcriptional regulator n=1 Tax=Cupriavidus sp. AU9028 TaxID=2871157 RepID=UPI001C980AFE|nr:AraC family transcriptional regulator [Cupriavidus sp. AU9028]MBY4897929.1 AraC family transcriptional regulator [Cupriavidus sp. AU9028]
MDPLSTLVQLLSPTGTLDLRCRIAAPWTAAHAQTAPGRIPYHAILQGEARIEGLAAPLRLAPGDIVLFPRGAAHHLLFAGGAHGRGPASRTRTRFNGVVNEVSLKGSAERRQDDDLDMLCGTFTLGAPGAMLLQALPEVLHIGTAGQDDSRWLRGLLEMMRTEAAHPQPGSQAIVGELSTALFTGLLRTVLARGTVATGLLALMADGRLARAVQAMFDAPERPWSVAGLAALANMSRATLARRFAGLGQTTPLELLTRLRMQRAATLLESGNAPIAAVGQQCGYQSQAAFGRVFRQHYGTGPRAWRAERRRASA